MKQTDGDKAHGLLNSLKDNSKTVEENIKLRDQLKDLCNSLDRSIEKATYNKPSVSELRNGENASLKAKITESLNSKESISELTNKLKGIEQSNDQLIKEINRLKVQSKIQSQKAKLLPSSNNYEQKVIKLCTDEIKASKEKIKEMENTLEKKTTTAKSQFEQMLMLDHKYRELKEQLTKDKQ